MALRLYKLVRTDSYDYGYAKAIVVAESEQQALTIHPDGKHKVYQECVGEQEDSDRCGDWTTIEYVSCSLVGIAHPTLKVGTVVLHTYHDC